ncbi:hypothetical protein IGI04_034971 [Brassica rapa subsp. trilocularis]|uniref:Uncharacterized protein n=1 Tax=Brassica rapa subsp. trilocularis TaxID=1813537 RepID=A0ABQ7LCK4_BRACM|nr:hypothetical protein IGI04_034971 [Brassica rapa subsp. trilocularis]
MLTIQCIYAHIHSIVLRRMSVIIHAWFAPDKNRGVILIFKGIIESIPEVYVLLNVMRILGLLVQGVVAAKAIRLNLSSYSSLSPCQTSVNQKQKTIVTFLTSCRKGKRRSLLTVKSVLNNTIPSFKDNGTAEEPSKILLDKLFARTHEHTNENLVYPPDEALSYSTLGGLGLTFKLR